MIKIFYGKDSFSLNKAVSKCIEPGAEVQIFEDGNFEGFASQVLSQSFFAAKRVFVAKSFLKKIDAKVEEKLLGILKDLSDDTLVIFTEEELPKSKIVDLAKKSGEVKEFPDLKNINLISFIKEKIAEEGAEIAPLAAERLASFVGSDLWQLSEEINKLVLYKKGEKEPEPIQTADVELLVRANFEANIFALLDSVSAKNKKRSVDLLNSFLDSGENGIYILTMIAKQFRNIAMAKFGETTEVNLAKKAKLHPFVAKKAMLSARNFSKEEILEIYGKLRWADLKLKSGYEPEQVLLKLIA